MIDGKHPWGDVKEKKVNRYIRSDYGEIAAGHFLFSQKMLPVEVIPHFGNVLLFLHPNVLSVMHFVTVLSIKKVTFCLYPKEPGPFYL